MTNSLGDIMKQAQKMQEDVKNIQAEIEALEITGESGAGLVKVIMTGKREVRKVTIDKSLVEDDKDMLEDLVASAMNDAVRKVSRLKKEKMTDVTSGFPMPPGFKMPF